MYFLNESLSFLIFVTSVSLGLTGIELWKLSYQLLHNSVYKMSLAFKEASDLVRAKTRTEN